MIQVVVSRNSEARLASRHNPIDSCGHPLKRHALDRRGIVRISSSLLMSLPQPSNLSGCSERESQLYVGQRILSKYPETYLLGRRHKRNMAIRQQVPAGKREPLEPQTIPACHNHSHES